jgi:hypothetical protein
MIARFLNWAKAKSQTRKAEEIIVRAIDREAERFPEFGEKFRKALDQMVTDEKERRVLRERGRL